MQCPKCGTENKDTASTCASCYYDLSSTKAPVVPKPVNKADNLQAPAPVEQASAPTATETAPGFPANPAPVFPGYQSGENTSGMGSTAAVPAEIRGWNWGAFLLSWIWAIGNSTWIGLAALLPYVGVIMAIVLGIKGNEWAWQNKRWESVEQFKKTQKVWTNVGAVLFLVWCVIVLMAILLPVFLRARATAQGM